jgi:predicted transcriptional regulator of viral defense system
MRQQVVDPDRLVARNAARQHGIVTIEQLRRAGLSDNAVKRRATAGRLHRIYRGVYAVGHAGLSQEGRWMAAVKACGEGAALSHRSAAELWALLEIRGGPAHVTVPVAGGRARRTGIHVHRSPSLIEAVRTLRRGVAVATPVRTLTDLRRAGEPAEFRSAIRAWVTRCCGSATGMW